MKKPKWIVEKEQAKKASAAETVWLFGLHAVRDALENPAREKLRLIVTKNALDKLEAAVAASGMEPELSDPRRFSAPIDPQSVHQGAVRPRCSGPAPWWRRAIIRRPKPGLWPRPPAARWSVSPI